MTGSPQVLIKDEWCQQYPSHSIGDLVFGPDGALYVTGGDGSSFNFADYGQGGGSLPGTPTPKNPCGDPPAGVGGTETPPTAEGGALRCQSPGRAAGEPVLLNGSLLRIDPATGAGLPDNPHGGAATRTPSGSSPTGCATRSASPSGRGRASSGSATSATTPGRRSTGDPRRPARCRTSAGPATRGTHPSLPTRAPA